MSSLRSGPPMQRGEATPLSIGTGTQLPVPLNALIDREQALADVVSLLRSPGVRLLTLTGPGGVGKTRLAIAAAEEVAAGFPDGTAFIGLASVTMPSQVIPTIARSLGFHGIDEESPRRLVDMLTDKRLLLILDNFEHVVDAGRQLHEILAQCSGVTTLITSRVRLRLSGEYEIPVFPLTLPASTSTMSVREAEKSGAVQLFLQRARAIRPGFVLTADNLPAILEIAQRLDGLPLAIELAAARLKVMPPITLLARLQQRLPLLTGGSRDLPLRQQTMRDTIGWSYDLLTETEQVLFRRLAVFVGGFTLEAAEYVGGRSDPPQRSGPHPSLSALDTVEALSSLVEQSLLGQSAGPEDEPRYQMLETVREFGLERLEASGPDEERAVRAAHAAYALEIAAPVRERQFAPGFNLLLARLDAEVDNIRAALEWTASAGEAELGLRLATMMGSFWIFRGHFREGRQWLERFLTQIDPAPTALRTASMVRAGWMATLQGEPEPATMYLTEGLSLARAVPVPWMEALALLGLGTVELQRGAYTQAVAWSDQARSAFEELENVDVAGPHFLSVSYANRAQIALVQGDLSLAASLLAAAEQRQRALNFSWGLGDTVRIIGDQARGQGDYERALACYQESLDLARDHGDKRLLAEAVSGLAIVVATQREPERAAQLLGAAAALRQQIGTSIQAWDRPAYERGIEMVREALSAGSFASAWAAGEAWPLEVIAAEATIDEKVSAGSVAPAPTEAMPFVGSARPAAVAPAAIPLVGRERELATLHVALEAAVIGQGKVLLVVGAAGVGKTSLAAQFCLEAAERDVPTLIGRCYDLSDTPPYGPWIDLFSQLPAGMAPAPVAIARFQNGGSVSAETLVGQIRDYLAASTTARPLIILLDDMQWADAASLDLLRAVARHVTSLPVVLIVTYRFGEVTREHPLAHLVPLLEREAQAIRLSLRPLPREAVTEMATAEFGLATADLERLVSYLFDRAGGNALFTRQLLNALVEEGVLREEAATSGHRWQLGQLDDLGLPVSLRLVIEVRLGRLSESAREALTLAAAIGERVEFETWLVAAGVAEEQLLETLERAAALNLVTVAADGSGFSFSHALIREVLYESVLPLRRRSLHLRVAEALLAGQTQVPDVVAFHLRRAGDPRAVSWLTLAGEAAERVNALSSAADRFDQAAALLMSPNDASDRAWLLFRAAVLRRFRDPEKGLASLAQAAAPARDVGDASLTARILIERGHLLCLQGRFQAGLVDVSDGLRAMEALPEGATYDRWPGEARHVANRGTLAAWYALIGRLAAARDMAQQALDALDPEHRDLSALAVTADACHALGIVAAVQGHITEAREAFARGREALRAYQHDVMIGVTLRDEMALVVLPYLTEDLHERERLATEAEQVMSWSGAPVSTGETSDYVRDPRIPLLFLEGRWEEARRVARATLDQVAMIRHINNSVLGMIARASGDREQAWQLVHDTLPAGPATEPGDLYMPYAPAVQRLAGQLALDEGDIAVARAWLAAHDRWLTWMGARLGRADGETLRALCSRAAGDQSSALTQAERAMQLALEPRQPIALLAATRLAGELNLEVGKTTEALATLYDALAIADACAAPYERALTLISLAEAMIATRDRKGVNAALAEAQAICAGLGALPALARIDRITARLADAERPAKDQPGPGTLTRREREVVRLLMQGLSDREIAAALSISERTAGNHVQHIMQKFNVESRTAAALVAARRGFPESEP